MRRRSFALKIIYFFLFLILIPKGVFAVTVPTLVNQSATSIGQTTVNLYAQIDTTGGEDITERGFEYGTTTSYGATVSETGTFSSSNIPFLFDATWATLGGGDGEVDTPFAIVESNDGSFFVSDTGNNRIQKFDSSGTYVEQFGGAGSDPGEFDTPKGIAINTALNLLYVVNAGNHRVDIFTPSEKNEPASYVSSFGTSGTGDGEFDTPVGIAVDQSNNTVYVSDSVLDRVQKFDSSGVYIDQFGTTGTGNGEFDQPKGIFIDQGANIYVVDSGNNRIQKFNSEFQYLDLYGSLGAAPGQFTLPTSAYYDANSGHIYVVDSGNNRIQKFDTSFQYLGQWGETGAGNGQFSTPSGVVVTGSEQQAIVVDSGNNRIQHFAATNTNGEYSLPVEGLTCNTTYHFRAYAINTAGTGYGDDMTVTTAGCPPTVTTGTASSITPSSATLGASVDNDEGSEVTNRGVEYGLSTGYGNQINDTDTGAGEYSVVVASTLLCDTTYHFRAYAINANGYGYGSDNTFTTSNCVPPTVTTDAASNINGVDAQLNATIIDTGGATATQAGFDYGETTDYGTEITLSGSFGLNDEFSGTASGLTCGTTYHFRAWAFHTEGGSRGYGSDRTFTTKSCPTATRLSSFPEDRALVPNGSVNAIVVTDDTVYIGGSFTSFQTYTGSAVPFNTTTGQALNSFPVANSSILNTVSFRSVISDRNGGWYVSGDFNSIGGVQYAKLAHILADGSIDTAFVPPQFAVGTVRTMALSPDGAILYIGGDFTATMNNQSRSWIAALYTSDGSGVSGFNNISSSNTVTSLALSSDGQTLYVGGLFTSFNSTTRNRLAAVNTSTGALTSFDPNMNSNVFSLILSPNDSTLYVGGAFTSVNGSTTRNRLAAFDTSTGIATSFNPNIGGTVLSLSFNSDQSLLYAAGAFTSVNGGTTRNRLAAFDTSTGIATSFNPNIGGTVFSILLSPDDSTLYAGGSFTAVNGGTTRNYLTAFDTSTGIATSFDPNPNNTVSSMALSSDAGVLYTVGSFTQAGTKYTRNRVAAFDRATNTLASFNPNVNNVVTAMALSPDESTLYVGGYFSTVNGGTTRNAVAAFSTINGIVTQFNAGPDGNGSDVRTLVLSHDGTTLYIAGNFSTVSGQTRNKVAAIGTQVSVGDLFPFDPNIGDNLPLAFALSPDDSTLYIGGGFTQVKGGQQRKSLAAFSTNGAGTLLSLDKNFNNAVYALTVSPDGSTLYTGGAFSSIDGQTRSKVAAIATETNELLSFDAGSIDQYIWTLATDPAGSLLYIGGPFSSVYGINRNRLAALDISSATLTDFYPDLSSDQVSAIAFSPDGATLYTGGGFTVTKETNYSHPYFTSFSNKPSVSSVSSSDTTTTSVTLSGSIDDVGGNTVTTRGFQYGTTTSYGTTASTTGTYSTGSFTAAVTGLSPGTLYHFRAFATSAAGTSYGDDLTFSTESLVTSPILSTSAATSITATTVTLAGEITDTGGANLTTRGFQYGTTTSYGSTTSTTGSYTTGAFTAAVTDLTCNTTYHFRSYGTNTAGTEYGGDQTFTTTACETAGIQGSVGGGKSGSSQTIQKPSSTPSSISQDTSKATEIIPLFSKTLRLGSRDIEVYYLQVYLNTHGFLVSTFGPGSPGKETIYFGKSTQFALAKFQERYKSVILTPAGLRKGTGIFGPRTRDFINTTLKTR